MQFTTHTTVCSSKCKKMTKAVTMAGWWTLFLPLFSTYSLSLPSGWACEAYSLLLWHWVAPQTGRGTDRTQLCCTTQSTAHRPVSITMMGGEGLVIHLSELWFYFSQVTARTAVWHWTRNAMMYFTILNDSPSNACNTYWTMCKATSTLPGVSLTSLIPRLSPHVHKSKISQTMGS